MSPEVEFDDENLQEFIKHLKYLLKDIINYKKQIEIPNYLKSFIERHLTAWIQSAIKAFDMEKGINYVIDVDKTAIQI